MLQAWRRHSHRACLFVTWREPPTVFCPHGEIILRVLQQPPQRGPKAAFVAREEL